MTNLVRRAFLCDVDGVLADFRSGILQTCSSTLKPDDIVEYDIFDALEREDPDKKKVALTACHDPSFWESLEVLPGALEFIEQLKMRYPGPVMFVSSPWWTCKNWEGARREWLWKNFRAKWNSLIPLSPKEHVAGAYLYDDRDDHLDRWLGVHGLDGGVAMLHATSYNSKAHYFKHTLTTALQFVLDRAESRIEGSSRDEMKRIRELEQENESLKNLIHQLRMQNLAQAASNG